MRRPSLRLAAALLAAAIVRPVPGRAWGLATHRMVEEEAIGTLPEPLRGWFHRHREEISDGSVEPDTVLRVRDGREEAVRHFIDLDLYGRPPFPDLPRTYRAAVERFGRETVETRGTVPWTIEEKHERLVRELRSGSWAEALRTAAHAGHYVADATMPLHTVSDYDGRESGLPGIHRAFEHAVVDARLRAYRKRVRERLRGAPGRYDRAAIFDLLSESFAAVPAVMAAEREARRAGEVGSPAYVRTVDRLAAPLVVERLTRAAAMLGAFWTSAWDEAGRPLPPRD
jgi:hypothetical protein